jgi:hypothetical protein
MTSCRVFDEIAVAYSKFTIITVNPTAMIASRIFYERTVHNRSAVPAMINVNPAAIIIGCVSDECTLADHRAAFFCVYPATNVSDERAVGDCRTAVAVVIMYPFTKILTESTVGDRYVAMVPTTCTCTVVSTERAIVDRYGAFQIVYTRSVVSTKCAVTDRQPTFPVTHPITVVAMERTISNRRAAVFIVHPTTGVA